MSYNRRRIAYDDTACDFFEHADGSYVLVLFDQDDKPLYKVAYDEASDVIEAAIAKADDHGETDIWLSRRVHKLLYERAVSDGAVVPPSPNCERPFHVQ